MRLVCAAFILLFIGCTGSDKKESANMPGAYKILSVSVKTDKTDTTYTNSNQLKIYTKDYMMYANIDSPDSVSGFGIGSYSVDKDTVTENVIYFANDTVSRDQSSTYKLAIEKTGSGYKQFIAGMQNNAGQKFDMTEAYDSVGTGTTTAVDGAWKLVKRYMVKGKDTTNSSGIQYKTYYAGYCIWGATWKDSLNKTHTGIGFGKFTMPADNKIKESMIASTYSQVRGHDFDIDNEMMSSDGFKQTINSPDGSKTVEVYERLK
jgi:hypothetical protein